MSTVLKKIKLDQTQKEFLLIKMRKFIFISWFLSKIGLNPVISLVCNKQSISFNTYSVRTENRSFNIPLIAVTAVSQSIAKPFGLLIFAVAWVLGVILNKATNLEIRNDK